MSKHTPGPWWIAGTATIRAGQDAWIASIKWRNREANARLIAAAPEMLAALRKAITYVELCCDETDGEEAAEAKHDLDGARAAIAKAEGR